MVTGQVRVLVTGSRDYQDWHHLRTTMGALPQELGIPARFLTIVHGGQGTRDREGRVVKGLDLMASEVAEMLGMRTEAHPADWDTCTPECPPRTHRRAKPGRPWLDYCPLAGYHRNTNMVGLHQTHPYDRCLGFPLGVSRGTRDCMAKAEVTKIIVVNCTEQHAGLW